MLDQILKFDVKLKTIISGGQTGADQAGLVAAKVFNLETGGFAPNGFMTVHGPFPALGHLYGLIPNGTYVERTEKNVICAHATIRFATNFQSPGEVVTLRAINKHRKPYLDVQLPVESVFDAAEQVADFIESTGVAILNVAGNSDRKEFIGEHFSQTFEILVTALQHLDRKGLLAKPAKESK